MGKNVYSSEVKWAVVLDKLSGELTTKEIMENMESPKKIKHKLSKRKIYALRHTLVYEMIYFVAKQTLEEILTPCTFLQPFITLNNGIDAIIF